MTGHSPAWLLDCGNGTIVALSLANVLHVVESADHLYKVPLAPAHCDRLLVWRDLLLPAVDLCKLTTGKSMGTSRPVSCIVGWRNRRDASDYGVLLCKSLPRRVDIGDEQQVLPSETEQQRWRGFALGFFTHSNRATPIIHPAALFGGVSSANDLSRLKESQLIA